MSQHDQHPVRSALRPALGERRALQRLVDRAVTNRWLIGDPGEPGRRVVRRTLALTVASIVTANVIGAIVVLSYAAAALPKPDLPNDVEVFGRPSEQLN